MTQKDHGLSISATHPVIEKSDSFGGHRKSVFAEDDVDRAADAEQCLTIIHSVKQMSLVRSEDFGVSLTDTLINLRRH